MKIYEHSFSCQDMVSPINNTWDFSPYDEYSPYELCFFDIETTGLSPATSSIYLIGAGHYEHDTFKVTQWFADDYDSEKVILESFLEYISRFRVLLQYNGNTFDLPFIRTKCKTHNVDYSIMNNFKHIDLYACLRRYSRLLNLPNKKLKSFEQYVGLNRDDIYNGGELIAVYSQYMQNKILHKENDSLLELLLLHNYEDITGLSQVASLLFLKELDRLPLTVTAASYSNNTLDIIYSCNIPGNYSFKLDIPFGQSPDSTPYNIVCSWSKSDIHLSIPVIQTTLNYYFSDYKDYYYMINEGTVMHKSVAVYTDASVRRKARKSECYVSRTGLFIPICKQGCFSKEFHIFKSDYTSKEYYIEYSEELHINTDLLIEYYRQMF